MVSRLINPFFWFGPTFTDILCLLFKVFTRLYYIQVLYLNQFRSLGTPFTGTPSEAIVKLVTLRLIILRLLFLFFIRSSIVLRVWIFNLLLRPGSFLGNFIALFFLDRPLLELITQLRFALVTWLVILSCICVLLTNIFVKW